MDLAIKVDLSSFKADLARATAEVERGRTDGLDRAAQATLNAKRRQVGVTYARPTNGWDRSGDWLQGQAIETPNPHERQIVTQGNAEKYERRLANLPTGADGINRTNKASENAARIVEPQVTAIIENAISNALRGI